MAGPEPMLTEFCIHQRLESIWRVFELCDSICALHIVTRANLEFKIPER